ncbi:penicillin-binding protein 1A [Piscinibacter koreensis]|uniref:Penicillin-binding protein 1A n=1 Tax=Piscinibacter koreensis TaxID=2742824 RepID=A0A7Y6NM40_9BURK|nr:penicillin-binding protein 1A [Schlegelella koreensis]NUZ05636.1 penicillin-binding protein 1A [Schlegelella koreensis]
MTAPDNPRREANPPRAPQPSFGAGVLRFAARFVSSFVGLVVAGALAVALLVGIALAVAYPNLPEISSLTDYRPKLPMRIYSADGVLLGEYGEERRNFIPIGEIPKVMKDAVLAAEDARFYEHGGVNYVSIIRAGLANFTESRTAQGASTITMQVARNFYLSTEKTFTRKIYEMLLSLKIETLLNKDQILEVYMNHIALGQRAFGFASASEIYFGKPLKDITIAEAAMLAGLPKAPSANNPIVNPERATIRQRYIIDRMLENGFITPEQHDAAKRQAIKYRAPRGIAVHAEYVAETARQMVYSQYGADAYTRGLNVYLTFNSNEQMLAYRALRKGIMDYERRQVYRGPEDYIDLPNDPAEIDNRVGEALQDYPDNDELKSAVVLEASPKKVVAMLQSGDSIDIVGDGLKPATSGLAPKANPQTQIRRGAVIRVIRGAKGDWSITQLPEVEGAFVALDPRTGAIRAMVGGFDFSKSKFNHVTQAWRQPGSSFKPFIYSAALEKGFTPSTVINDAPLFFDSGTTGSQPWAPKNYDGTFDGPMTMRKGLAKSKNLISIRILKAIGPQYAQEWVGRFGFDPEKHPAYLTMALGAGSVTPLQMASAYSVFASGGYRVNPALITRITDSKGKVLSEARTPQLDESMRVIEARNAFVMTSLLQEVTRAGTAAKAQATLKRPDIYGKTGTTNDSLDAWFAGWQHDVVAVVWMGYDNPRKLGDRETGGGLSLPIWIDYMASALRGVPVQEPVPPEGLVNQGGEWYYEEYARGTGISSIGLEDRPAAAPPNEDEERKSILDLFRR